MGLLEKEKRFIFHTYEEFEKVRQQISTYLQCASPHNHIMLEIALNEAVNNALFHTEKGTKIELKIRLTNSKRLIIRVSDNGEGFPVDGKLCDTGRDPFEERLFEESGRGLFLMKSIVDNVRFNKKGNEVMLIKHLGTEHNQFAS